MTLIERDKPVILAFLGSFRSAERYFLTKALLDNNDTVDIIHKLLEYTLNLSPEFLESAS